MKSIYARIMAFWAALMFIGTMLIALIPIWGTGFWPEPRRTDLMIKISRVWMAVFFFLSGLRLKIYGREHFKSGQNYIVVCNHRSMMDVPLTSPGIPGANKTIAKSEMAKIPLFGIIYKRGSVLVNRKSDASRKESYMKMRRVLEMGMHMCIYPEGTRNKTDKPLKEFHDGAFRLSLETRKSIMPAVIFGTNHVFPNNRKFWFWPSAMEMHFLEPISVSKEDTAHTLKEKAFRMMWDHIESVS
jgi:1-acyl-sn-glycerol-3-phosphate acyltransferase